MFPEWPDDPPKGGSWESIHALGMISSNYNKLEQQFRSLFLQFSGLPLNAGHYLFAKINNELRIDLTRKCIPSSRFASPVKERAECFIDGFSACNYNRNILMHAVFLSDRQGANGELRFIKAKKEDPRRSNDFLPTLAALRRIADETKSFAEFGLKLSRHITKNYEAFRPRPFWAELEHALPDKCPIPNRLTPFVPKVRNKPLAPPGSSRA